MSKLRVMVAVMAATAISPNVMAQSTPKPSPYTGVSQPPPDETITTDATTATSAAVKLETRPPAVPPVAITTATTASNPPRATTPKNWNPDYEMIGDSPSAAIEATPKKAAANDPDAGIVTFVPARPGELPEGTTIRMALDEELATGQSQPGADFSGKIAADVLSGGKVVIPQGSEVLGKVVRVTEGHRFGSPATIRLRPDVVVLPDGSRYVLRAQIIDTGSKARVDGEGTIKPGSRLKTNVIKEGVGIGTGATAGALIGGPAGALVGTLIGAGVMTTNILVQRPALVRVPKDSTLTLSLTQPMSITPVETN